MEFLFGLNIGVTEMLDELSVVPRHGLCDVAHRQPAAQRGPAHPAAPACCYDCNSVTIASTHMPITGNWIFTASMDVDPDKEAIFNEVYDTEHVPHLSKVPGVVSVTRFKLDTLRVTMGGETKSVDSTGVPRYACIVEIDSPDVLTSPAFAKAVDAGRWTAQVRPFTRNRHHTLHRLMK